MALALLAPMAMVMFAQSEQLSECEEPSKPDRIRGNYENKIRFYAPPEKCFEIFATHKTEDGELCMTYKNFLHAMTPYCQTPVFEGADDYLKDNTPAILARVDVNGDNLISFTEFFFFLVLLQVPPNKLRRILKKNFKDGKMTRGEASKTMREIRKSTTAGDRSQEKVRLDARQIKASDEDFMETNVKLCDALFADKECVTCEDLLNLRDSFRESLWHYQFYTFEPNEEGKISTENFLKSNLSCLTGGKLEAYRTHIRKVTRELGDNDPGFTVHEFIAFQHFFDQLDKLHA